VLTARRVERGVTNEKGLVRYAVPRSAWFVDRKSVRFLLARLILAGVTASRVFRDAAPFSAMNAHQRCADLGHINAKSVQISGRLCTNFDSEDSAFLA